MPRQTELRIASRLDDEMFLTETQLLRAINAA